MIRFGRYWLSVPASAEIHRTGAGRISMAKPPHFPNIVGCLIGFAAVGCGVGSLVGTAVEHHLKPKKGTFKIFRPLAPLTVRPHFQNQPRQLRHRQGALGGGGITHQAASEAASCRIWRSDPLGCEQGPIPWSFGKKPLIFLPLKDKGNSRQYASKLDNL